MTVTTDYMFWMLAACVQVHSEGGIRVGAGINGAIVIVILTDRDPLGSSELLFHVSGELLFQVMSDQWSDSPKRGRRRARVPGPHPRSCVWQTRQ
jgi:hypothetical protein